MLEKKNNVSVCVLASGSRGNSIYISDSETSILIDAGLSGIEIEKRLKKAQLNSQNLNAIVVSHDHRDHIHGVGILARRLNIPVYISKRSFKAAEMYIGKVDKTLNFECGVDFMIGKLCIHPFSTSHDSADSAGFTIKRGRAKIGIATDLGIATNVVKDRLKECGILVLEANHDKVMLETGDYPWALKQRIKSRAGHLSNAESRNLLNEIQHKHLKHVVLAHLSEKNNTPLKAFFEVCSGITRCNPNVEIALQDKCAEVMRLNL